MDSQNKQKETLEKLVSELRQCYGLGASFFRAVAARIEVTDTDLQVIDILQRTGDSTAGQLADVMGLTTGTFTAILNRLEKAGLVRRERDPNDGRRVIVTLVKDGDSGQEAGLLFTSLENAWEEMAAQYDDEQKAMLLAFLQRSNTLASEEIARLRGMPVGDEGIFSAPLDGLESAQLIVASDTFGLNLRAGDIKDALYQARFEGPVPDVKVKDGVVTIRYPRRLWLPGMKKRAAEVMLSTAIPWRIVLQGGASEITAELGDLDLLELEANGAGSMFSIELPTPTQAVPVKLGGSGSEFTVRRPPGIAAQVRSKGWGSGVIFDGELVSGVNSDGLLQSPGYKRDAPRYDIETSGSGSMFTITTG